MFSIELYRSDFSYIVRHMSFSHLNRAIQVRFYFRVAILPGCKSTYIYLLYGQYYNLSQLECIVMGGNGSKSA